MSNDKVTIGLTSDNQWTMDAIMASRAFEDQMDAAKFAISVAINAGVEPEAVTGTDTKWNIGSFDTGGELRNLLLVLFPGTEAPYRAAEHLMNRGLEIMRERMGESGVLDLPALMES